MSFIFHGKEQDGVLFYFHKCGTTNITTPMPDRTVYQLVGSSVYTRAGKTAYEYYNEKFVNFTQKKFVLVRHPLKRFISGYHHYYILIQSNLDNKKDWMEKVLNRKFETYDINLHCDAVKKISSLNYLNNNDVDFAHHCLDFFLHCIDDIGDHITDDMEAIRLGGDYSALEGTTLFDLINDKHINISKDTLHGNLPDLNWSVDNYRYITKKYKRTAKRLGYKYDH